MSYHYDRFSEQSISAIVQSLFMGWRLDFSMISYLLILPFILWALQQYFKKRVLHLLNEGYHFILIPLVTLLSIANIRMYQEWNTLLNYRALIYLIYPKEAMASLPGGALLTMLVIALLIIVAGIWVYRIASLNFSYVYQTRTKRILMTVGFATVISIGLRGGVQQIPINESAAYHSPHAVNNHVATNNIWYLAHSCLDAREKVNPYQFMDQKLAEDRVKKMFAVSDGSFQKILNTDKPNVVFIVLESWTADLVKKIGGGENITPNFNALANEGLLFTKAYTSGYRTDQGIVSILGGFPSQPNVSIMMIPEKAEKLKSINQHFVKKGYNSSFYYGGEIEFANMKTYLMNSGFQKFTDINNFEKDQLNSKWGAHDEYVLSRQLADLKVEKEPFFSVLLTLSTHEPFESPNLNTPFTGNTLPEKFKKAAYYTDHCLGNYFDEAKKQDWYSKTLFVLVADHGHHLPMERDMNTPESRQITLLFCGGALKNEYKGQTFDKIVAQSDLPAIILAQLNADYSEFKWSKNVFSTDYKQFTYYSNENVLGWLSSEGNITYSFVPKKISFETTENTAVSDSLLVDAQSYLQCLYREYLEK